MDLTHASFFSGAGGTDLGLERAGWHTVSFSEIDPYASAVLAERWPLVPNLGDITDIASRRSLDGRGELIRQHALGAVLWSGGFPCQDLSVAGKRAGFTGERSVLAFAFLDLVERYRPPAILLENVPGLLSSHGGRDMATLLGRMVELGYGVAYRLLDAQHFGVPQRRRRVFILGLRSDPNDADGRAAAERAAAVLSVGARCDRHPAAGHDAGSGSPGGIASSISASSGHHGHSSPRGDGSDNLVGTLREHPRPGSDTVGALTFGGHGGIQPNGQDADTGHVFVSPAPDASRVREADGLAGWPYDRDELAHALNRQHGVTEDGTGRGVPIIAATLTAPTVSEGGRRDKVPVVAATLNSGGNAGGFRTEPGEHLVSMSLRASPSDAHAEDLMTYVTSDPGDDELLPLGLDSHRYRCCGNGVVAPVATWLGARLAEALR